MVNLKRIGGTILAQQSYLHWSFGVRANRPSMDFAVTYRRTKNASQ